MNTSTLLLALQLGQTLIGISIVLSAVAVGIAGASKHATPLLVRYALVGLMGWGAWFAMVPWTSRGPDSLPAIAFGLGFAYVLARRGRLIAEILAGAEWWPPNARRRA